MQKCPFHAGFFNSHETKGTATMTTKSENDPRAEIVRLIAANKENFQAEQVEALFVVTVEDLISGGVDQVRVYAAMVRAWVRLQVAMRGAGATAELLRDFADLLERPALNSQKSTRPN
jgi:hypothetical protein